MYKIEWEKEAWMLAVMAAVSIGVMMTYPYLPDTLPMHWNVYGEVDRSVPKSPLNAFFHLGISWGLYLLMLYVPYIDPKRDRYGSFLEAYRLIRFSTILVLCMMSVLVTLWALGYRVPMEKVVPAICGVLYIFMGNLMGKVRMNWFVGFR